MLLDIRALAAVDTVADAAGTLLLHVSSTWRIPRGLRASSRPGGGGPRRGTLKQPGVPRSRARGTGSDRGPVPRAGQSRHRSPAQGRAKRVPVVGSHFSWGLGLSSPHGLYNFLLLENPFVVVVV